MVGLGAMDSDLSSLDHGSLPQLLPKEDIQGRQGGSSGSLSNLKQKYPAEQHTAAANGSPAKSTQTACPKFPHHQTDAHHTHKHTYSPSHMLTHSHSNPHSGTDCRHVRLLYHGVFLIHFQGRRSTSQECDKLIFMMCLLIIDSKAFMYMAIGCV